MVGALENHPPTSPSGENEYDDVDMPRKVSNSICIKDKCDLVWYFESTVAQVKQKFRHTT